jgi:hypothetical protein
MNSRASLCWRTENASVGAERRDEETAFPSWLGRRESPAVAGSLREPDRGRSRGRGRSGVRTTGTDNGRGPQRARASGPATHRGTLLPLAETKSGTREPASPASPWSWAFVLRPWSFILECFYRLLSSSSACVLLRVQTSIQNLQSPICNPRLRSTAMPLVRTPYRPAHPSPVPVASSVRWPVRSCCPGRSATGKAGGRREVARR